MLASAPLDTDVILNIPNMIRAWHVEPRAPGWVYVVIASVLIVPAVDRIYRPVLQTLAMLDVLSVAETDLYDPLYMSCRAVVRAYRVAGLKPAQTVSGPATGPPELRQERVA